VVLEGLREEFAKPKTPDPPILPEPREPIRFYNKGEPYYDFTNFAPVPVYYEEEWKTSEHLFQAWKVRRFPFLIGMIIKRLIVPG